MISVLILTRDEAQALPECLDSVAWSDDVHVLDSLSSDGTQQIARERGAHVTERPFDGYATQRNAGLALPFRHEWILILDADERPSAELSEEMQTAVLTAPPTVTAFRVRRRDYLWGTWLKHAQLTPTYIRLVRRGRARYVREINEVLETDGQVADLHAPLEHYPFLKGMSWWLDRHNRYSTAEAQLLAAGSATSNASWRQALLGKSLQERRAAQKAIFYKMPGRPLVKWMYMMFVRGAVLDGSAGWTYATLQSIYEYMIEVKRREIELRARNTAGRP
ncbi:glycosyltransferase family 2 protein [Terriglobus aquaticus]|uniref:Glycosyltransferase family 2 protein n=1 Tax=Terriglobus aquaticus TaxID=940139 RepID=A0ABW9KM30_9BACT|nr:glycosyltransferase family 2 protein [Terriglobus aquaticus]